MKDIDLDTRLNQFNMLDTITEAIRYCDRDFRILWVNKAACESACKDYCDVIGKFCYKVWQNREEPCADCPAVIAKVTGKPVSAEVKSYTTGKIFYIRVYPDLDDEGNVIGLLEFVYDITKQKEIEKKLHESEQKYRAIFENNIYAMAVCEKGSNRFIDVNDSFCEVYGYSREEFTSGITISDLCCDDETCNEFLIRFNENKRDHLSLIYHRRKNGEVFPVEIFWKDIDLHDKQIKTIIIKDISEELKAKILEKERSNQLQTLIDSLPGYAFFKDKESRFIIASKKLYDDLRVTPDQFIGKTDLDFFPVHIASKFREDDKVVLSGKKEIFETEEDICFDGKCYVVSTRKVPVRDANGEIVGLIGLAFDITDRKKMEEELIDTNIKLANTINELNLMAKKAEEASRAKSEFLAKMSHEIRTPMNGILGVAELLMGLNLTEKQREYVSIIKNSGEILLGIINDILDFSKIEVGKLELENVGFDLYEILKNTVGLMFASAREKGLFLGLEIGEDVPRNLSGDPTRLRQILMNLMGNAIKFTKKGEILVIVTLENRFENKVKLKFSVKDTGIGIPKEQLSNLFEPFTQVDSSVTRKFGGTGLGLAISKELATMMGGEIGCESEVDVGSTFWFTAVFDLAEEKSKMDHKSDFALEEGLDQQSARILVVEDNAVNQIVISELLKRYGYEVEIAQNGQVALDKLKTDFFDLVLMDCEMPVMDGFEATKRIRKGFSGETNRDIPIIAMTAYATFDDQRKCFEAGMDDFLTKPVQLDKLRQTVSSVLINKKNRRLSQQDQDKDNAFSSSEPYLNGSFILNESNSIKKVDFNEPVFDWNIYLNNVMLDESLAKKGIMIFLDTIPEQILLFKDALKTMDFPQMQKISHKIKGAAGTLGALRFHRLFALMEEASKNKDLNVVNGLSSFVDESFEELKKSLENYL